MCFWKNLANFVGMKNSIDFLPERKQRDLHELAALIRDEVKDVVMIILYGSYAANTYVERDERRDYGVRTIYMSDYDLLVVTKRRLGERESTVEARVRGAVCSREERREPAPTPDYQRKHLQAERRPDDGTLFLRRDRRKGNHALRFGRMSVNHTKRIDYAEIKAMAEEYYTSKYIRATYFFDDAITNIHKNRFVQASFYLHQAAEYFLKAILLVYILYGYKEHDLEFLIGKCKPYTLELAKVFPCDTDEEKRLFDLLRRAYLEARYNDKFVVTKADIDALVPKIELLRDIVEKVCEEQIVEYKRLSGR